MCRVTFFLGTANHKASCQVGGEGILVVVVGNENKAPRSNDCGAEASLAVKRNCRQSCCGLNVGNDVTNAENLGITRDIVSIG